MIPPLSVTPSLSLSLSMDINPPGQETSEHMITWSENFAENLVDTKSFRCTFCKRGFSNAQALGGHMNIHRKDRAKLKEFSRENLLSLDITKNSDREDSPPPDHSSASKRSSSENDDQSPDDYKVGNLDDVEENSVRRLPLFAEAPSVNGGGREEEGGDCVERRKVELSHGELDLELRLGPEPHHAKSKP